MITQEDIEAMRDDFGPTLQVSEDTHRDKYRGLNESFPEAMYRIAGALADNNEHHREFLDALLHQRFLPAGRIQAAVGSPKRVTAFNCYVMPPIEDSMGGILKVLGEAAETMRMGGGVGYDFSTLRPRGDLIKSLDSKSSGPIEFMGIFDAMCKTIMSAGHRRGAQMGVLRVDHPDIEEFIRSKQNTTNLKNFNISVAVTDEFMKAVMNNAPFNLKFDGRVYKTVDAASLWDEILRSTWDWAEPGVLFIDVMNRKNNLHHIETIAATNPCAEQSLPPYGACLLGSFNLVKYVEGSRTDGFTFNYEKFKHDIPHVVRAIDNVIDRTIYPLPEQKVEAHSKRRMGLGVTGLANAGEALGYPYASEEFILWMETVFTILRDTAYIASISLAMEKGPFPLFDKDTFGGFFWATLPEEITDLISEYGIRNSHLLSVAPTGTISLSADNVSSGIEPVFSHPSFSRMINTADGLKKEIVEDYGYRVFGVKGRTADSLSVKEHLKVLITASKYVDSAVSKTCNVGPNVTWQEFKDIYMSAYMGGASGCTTFRANGKRAGILEATYVEESPTEDGAACYIDANTGKRTCE